jgi:hypothetical protein
MHIIVQVMLSNPSLQSVAVCVMEACVKRPATVPNVVEFLKRNPEKSLLSLYDALQVCVSDAMCLISTAYGLMLRQACLPS